MDTQTYDIYRYISIKYIILMKNQVFFYNYFIYETLMIYKIPNSQYFVHD